jgi:hypothetical protein
MNASVVEKIADAVLYEGYILYPYRASAVKNRQRFNFGVLYPREYCDLQSGSESWEMRTECLVLGSAATAIEVKVRFLQLAARGEWQEGQERDVCIPACRLESIAARPYLREFVLPGEDAEGRLWQTFQGELELGAAQLDERLFKVTLSIRNLARLENANDMSRDEVLLRSMVSVHSILHAVDGGFVSLLDPPEQLKSAAAECRNTGTWPVLAGVEGQRDLVLSAPIILYDYPQIAPESAGDLFDGTEIDEILALRILTMTDAEKLEVRNGDDRARRILERTELLPPEHFQKLHGALRGLRVTPDWQTLEDKPAIDRITVDGVEITIGDRVRLRPRNGGDIMDLALAGKIGIIESIEQDYEDKVQVAIVMDDDPGKDLGLLRQPGHRFFFNVEEIEPL